VVSGDASEAGRARPPVAAVRRRHRRWESVAAYDVQAALPSQAPPMGRFQKAVRLEPGLYVCGDHRDSASIQGALVSGRRAADAVLAELRGVRSTV
jgi:predicted NAD/FAD-dependent oxidoreductase